MSTYVILASGHSLNDSDVEYVKIAYHSGVIDGVISVSDVGLLKAPWATALVSHDSKWWRAHPEHADFQGQKYCANQAGQGIKVFNHRPHSHLVGCNSGLYAMYVAREVYKAEKIILLGFDLNSDKGAHFFGEHTAKFMSAVLKNSTDADFRKHIKQFNNFSGCEVINCTRESSLHKFPFMPLKSVL